MANPFMGTWKLNTGKSKLAKGTDRNNTVSYDWAFFRVKVTIDGTGPHGTPTHSEWIGNFDGREYPVTGDAMSDARIYRQVDEHTMDFWQKKGGKVTLSGRILVAPDGKSRTVTAWGRNGKGKRVKTVAVYDKV